MNEVFHFNKYESISLKSTITLYDRTFSGSEEKFIDLNHLQDKLITKINNLIIYININILLKLQNSVSILPLLYF
jgi:hypothetical protein